MAGKRLVGQAYALAVQHGYKYSAPFTELEAAWPAVKAALPLLIGGDNARLQTVCYALQSFLNFTGSWDDWLSLSQEAEAKALAAADHYHAGWRAYATGVVHALRGEADAVFACAERCARHWHVAQAGARERAAGTELRGHGYRFRKDYPAAIVAYQQSLGVFRSLGLESADVATVLNSLAEAKLQSGDLDGAEADYREAQRIARKVADREGIAIYTGNLADVFLGRQDWPAAERQTAEALELDKALGRQELIGADHHRFAKAMLHQQRASEALPHAQKAVAIYTRLRSRDLAEAKAILTACEAACSSSQPG